MPPSPAHALLEAPLHELIAVLYKQFNRLLAQGGVLLSTQEVNALAAAAADHQPLPPAAERVCERLAALIHESEQELQTRFQMSFAQALASDMSQVGGWETTAEFLELANHKSNAELRISAASSLLLMLGDARFAHHAYAVIDADAGLMDVDACFARRGLCHCARIEPLAEDWLAQVQAVLPRNPST
ncbi:MAG: hypothetical protein SNJ54_07185 [Anaerolineae bacterium]